MSSATEAGSTPSRAVGILAPAKINLFLHVGEKRPDAYHALESLIVFAECADRLEFAPAGELSLRATGPFAPYLPKDEANLALKAARLLAACVAGEPPGAAIAIEKNLPVAGGLGGGSADAAAVLRGLNILWHLDLGEARLLEIAARLGSDVPACLLSRPCWMEGRGERVTKVPPLPNVSLLLVNPGIMVPTGDVFAALNARTGLGAIRPPPAGIESLWDLVAYLDDATNDLEAPAARIAPAIEEVLDALSDEPGCVMAQMSGSGATCFGLFDGRHVALRAAENLAYENPDWWVRATRLASADIGAPHWNGM